LERAHTVDESTLACILDSLRDPVLVADTEHRIVYMNAAAAAHYPRGAALLGTSLLDCHNERSGETIKEVLEAMKQGEEERLITDNERHRIYMRAVRHEGGELIGYYERYAPPSGAPKEE
jgi:PAS domain-containing protein